MDLRRIRIFYRDFGENSDSSVNPDKNSTAPLRLNNGYAGKSGRRKLALVDWDGDGRLDILVDSQNANFLRNIGNLYFNFQYKDEGPILDDRIASHSSSPFVVDWNDNGIPELLIGAEDGFFYYYQNSFDSYRRRK